jgi:hypothetical protein
MPGLQAHRIMSNPGARSVRKPRADPGSAELRGWSSSPRLDGSGCRSPPGAVHGSLTFDEDSVRLLLSDPLRAPQVREDGIVSGSPEPVDEAVVHGWPARLLPRAASTRRGGRRQALRFHARHPELERRYHDG